MNKDKVYVITGPTGIGKTDLSLSIASSLNGEVINADASQFKKLLNIGTSKTDTSNNNIKHHLIDIIGPTDNYSIYDFQANARKLIHEINERGHVPILVGGSGLYINACVYDYDLKEAGLSLDFSSYSDDELYDLLLSLDPNTTIHKNNRRRVERAINLIKSGKDIHDTCDFNSSFELKGVVLDTDRDILYDRINKRVDQMIDCGLLDEIKNLIDEKIDLSKVNEIGYKEFIPYFYGLCTLDAAIDEVKKNTRHLAKRQLTWFRNKMNFPFVMINYDNLEETKNEILKIFNE